MGRYQRPGRARLTLMTGVASLATWTAVSGDMADGGLPQHVATLLLVVLASLALRAHPLVRARVSRPAALTVVSATQPVFHEVAAPPPKAR